MAYGEFTTAPRLIVYTADKVGNLTITGFNPNSGVNDAPTFKLNGLTSGVATIKASDVAGTPTITLPAISGMLALSSGSTPVAAGASLTLTTANAGSVILLNTAAGSTVTLPAATGTGAQYRFFVTTTATSNAHKILAASVADFLQGVASGHIAAGTTLTFQGVPSTSHSIQMPFAGTQPSGGFAGDWFRFTDVATNLWSVEGMYQSGTTSTTPFSTATT